MAVPADLFGVAYLDAESFRATAELFGVGMSLRSYPEGSEGDVKLTHVLQAASRAVDAFCCRDFSPDNRSEKHKLDVDSWKFTVHNRPVLEVVSCVIRYAIDGTMTIDPAHVFINNQAGYLEVTRGVDGMLELAASLGNEIDGPIAEITYKSLATVPPAVKTGTGYQAAHMINAGFVDANAPTNFGNVDLGGMKLNNIKGRRNAEDSSALAFSPEAARVLQPFIQYSVS